MARRGVRLVVLCEDDEHYRFSRSVLLELGCHPRELRFLKSPAGRGSAEQWVREHYPQEVKIHRQKAHSQRIGLVVIIDADTESDEGRHNQLDSVLKDQGIPPRGADEAIILWIPRRHIETWLAYLTGHQVDETSDCKAMVRDQECRKPACRFVALYRSTTDRPAGLPSMERAFVELERLPTTV